MALSQFFSCLRTPGLMWKYVILFFISVMFIGYHTPELILNRAILFLLVYVYRILPCVNILLVHVYRIVPCKYFASACLQADMFQG